MNKDIVLKSGKILKYYDLLSIVENELDDNTHSGVSGDYATELDFYLSNIKKVEYAYGLISTFLVCSSIVEYDIEDIKEIHSLVIDKIKEIVD